MKSVIQRKDVIRIAKEEGLSYHTVYARWVRGGRKVSEEELRAPLDKSKEVVMLNGLNLRQIQHRLKKFSGKEIGIRRLRARVRYGRKKKMSDNEIMCGIISIVSVEEAERLRKEITS